MNNSRLKYYTIASLFLVLIIDTMGIGLVLPLIGPLFISKTSAFVAANMSIGMRDLLYGITLAIFTIFMFFGAPFLGDLSDHLGRKKVLLICIFGTAVGLIISAIGISAHSMLLLILGRALAGFLAGSESIAQAAIVDISPPERKTINLSLISVASCIGFVLGPAMSGIVSDKSIWSGFGLAVPFWLAAGLAFINGVALLITFHETFFPKVIQKLNFTKGVEVFISAFTNKTIRRLTIIYLIAEAGWALYFQSLSLYLINAYNYSTNQIGHLMAWMGAVFGITLLLIIRLVVKYIKTEKIAYLALFLTSFGTFMILINNELIVWLSIIPTAIGGGLFYVAFLTLFSDAIDKDSQGWVMGIFAAVVAISWSLGGIFSGILSTFNMYIPFVIAGVLLLLSAVLTI